MNPSASLIASSVIFNTGSENFGVITAANVTFNDGSANSGAVIGNARFNGSAIHRVGAVVTGDASFSAQATNSGTVAGSVTVDGSGGGSGSWYDDASDAAHTVTLNGSVTQSDEGGGVKAALFDGSTGYLSLDPQGGFTLDGAFAFEGFFKPSSFYSNGTGSSHIIVLDDYITGFVIRYVYYGVGNNGLQFFIASNDSSGNTNHITQFPFVLDQTYYIAISRDNSGLVSVYIDGSLIDTFTNTNTVNCSTNIVFGRNTWNNNEYYTGKMYNVRLIKDATLDGSVPSSLPTAVNGTQLLLNFGATAVATV